MSKHVSATEAPNEPITLEAGLEAFQSSPEFRGPVEALDGHGCNDHFAHIYESREEKFEAAIPFVRDGLEQGERIAYVVDESTESNVRAAMEDAGIDVDAAVASGALLFYTVQDTCLRDGSFDADEMIQFYADATAEATEEYEALRLVAEMTWIDEADTTVEHVMEFKRLHNDDDEYSGTGIGLSLCQKVVNNHSGEIWLEPEQGEGSTFSFTLPAATEPDM